MSLPLRATQFVSGGQKGGGQAMDMQPRSNAAYRGPCDDISFDKGLESSNDAHSVTKHRSGRGLVQLLLLLLLQQLWMAELPAMLRKCPNTFAKILVPSVEGEGD